MAIKTIHDADALLLYKVGPVYCCSPTMPVVSVQMPPRLNHPPGTEPGVFNRPEGLVRVVNLRKRFGVNEEDWLQPGRIVVAEVEGGMAGFWVDEIIDVIQFPNQGWGDVPALVPRNIFTRTLLFNKHIQLYADFEKINLFRETGYLRKHIERLKEEQENKPVVENNAGIDKKSESSSGSISIKINKSEQDRTNKQTAAKVESTRHDKKSEDFVKSKLINNQQVSEKEVVAQSSKNPGQHSNATQTPRLNSKLSPGKNASEKSGQNPSSAVGSNTGSNERPSIGRRSGGMSGTSEAYSAKNSSHQMPDNKNENIKTSSVAALNKSPAGIQERRARPRLSEHDTHAEKHELFKHKHTHKIDVKGDKRSNDYGFWGVAATIIVCCMLLFYFLSDAFTRKETASRELTSIENKNISSGSFSSLAEEEAANDKITDDEIVDQQLVINRSSEAFDYEAIDDISETPVAAQDESDGLDDIMLESNKDEVISEQPENLNVDAVDSMLSADIGSEEMPIELTNEPGDEISKDDSIIDDEIVDQQLVIKISKEMYVSEAIDGVAELPIAAKDEPDNVNEVVSESSEDLGIEAEDALLLSENVSKEQIVKEAKNNFSAEISKDEEGLVIVLNQPEGDEESPVFKSIESEDAPVKSVVDTEISTIVSKLSDEQVKQDAFNDDAVSVKISQKNADVGTAQSNMQQVTMSVEKGQATLDTTQIPEKTVDKKLGQSALKTSVIIHVVVKGDTLWHIAKRYINDPFKYPELARLSKIRNPDLIYPGDKVKIIKKSRKQ